MLLLFIWSKFIVLVLNGLTFEMFTSTETGKLLLSLNLLKITNFRNYLPDIDLSLFMHNIFDGRIIMLWYGTSDIFIRSFSWSCEKFEGLSRFEYLGWMNT